MQTRRMTNEGRLIVVRNDIGDVVSMLGELPNGQIGYWIDEHRPFTDAELADTELLERHLDDLSKRVDKEVFIS